MPSEKIDRKRRIQTMERYDYRSSVKEALKSLIEDEFRDRLHEYESLEEFREALDDSAWTSDSVTGNASGSHTFSAWKAEENLCHNWDLLEEACREFGTEFNPDKGAEHWDVTIRCYVLGQVIDDAIEEAGITEESFIGNQDEEVAE